MKKLVIFIISFTFIIAVAQSTFVTQLINLSDKQSFILPKYDYSDTVFTYYHDNEIVIAQKYIDKANKSPLISALVDDSTIWKELSQSIKSNCEVAYDNNRCYPVFLDIKSHWNLNPFLHKILKIKKVREYAANLITNVLVDFCKLYPQDFREYYIEYLSGMLEFIHEIPEHKYRIKSDKYGYSKLYIDGREDDEVAIDIRGFILRRYIVDEIPLCELEMYINKALLAIKTVDVSSNPRFMYVVNINNHFNYIISAEGSYFKFPRKKDNLYFLFFDDARIICHSDNSEYIYTLESGYINKEKKWVTQRTRDNQISDKIIFDSMGDILVEEHNE